jgi:predicted nucleic acid-binding protein
VIVLDSSAAIDYFVGSTNGAWVEERLREAPEIHAPHLLDVEVIGALRRLVQLGDVPRPIAEQAIVDLEQLDVTRYPHLPFLARIWELRENLTAGDATFAALAEALGATLVTTDPRLALAPGIQASVVAP